MFIVWNGFMTPGTAVIHSLIYGQTLEPATRIDRLHCVETSALGKEFGSLMRKTASTEKLLPVPELLIRLAAYIQSYYSSDIQRLLENGTSVLTNQSLAVLSRMERGNGSENMYRLRSELKAKIHHHLLDYRIFTPDHHFYLRLSPEQIIKVMEGEGRIECDAGALDEIKEMVRIMDGQALRCPSKYTTFEVDPNRETGSYVTIASAVRDHLDGLLSAYYMS